MRGSAGISAAHLLVERSGLESERVSDVVDGNGTILSTLLGLLSRGVGTYEMGKKSARGPQAVAMQNKGQD